MPDVVSPPRLVGQPLLYAISIFASLGVFLVRLALHPLFFLSDASHLPNSLATTKGMSSLRSSCLASHGGHSVMSGIITGPYFRNFFNFPSAIELGTMVAVLEVGAFSAWMLSPLSSRLIRHSYFRRGRASRGRNRTERHSFYWRSSFHSWRCCTDIHTWVLEYGYWPDSQWLRCWATVVCRPIVPISCYI